MHIAALLLPLNDAATAACVAAERAMSRALNGSCQVPLAGYATLEGDTLTMNGLVASVDGTTYLTAQAQAPSRYADALGRAIAKQLLDQGADDIIAALSDPA